MFDRDAALQLIEATPGGLCPICLGEGSVPIREDSDEHERCENCEGTGTDTLALCEETRDQLRAAAARIAELEALINTPRADEFFGSVRNEAAHQVTRWGSEHDAGKTDADWFWLVGYLAGKALHNVRDKQAHHIIATAAALLNWYRAVTGESNAMRPGIETPVEQEAG